ncbi:fasciculation and elongation protein zeta-2 isoform X2 [Genypterus blacodes]|uniref:fasciculation and elongation protein zeta-2 isoform X2 n=1 Tax=Genypterus blacodes TaxID=154954 RepID=UPI003F76C596
MATPLAHSHDAFSDLSEFSMVSERFAPLKGGGTTEDAVAELPELHDAQTGAFKSVDELVNGLEQKLPRCFGAPNPGTKGSIAPVDAITEETLLESDEIWQALTENFGHVMPVDWMQSRTRSLHFPSLNLEEKPKNCDVMAELSDEEEELREQLDMHSIIVSFLPEEPLFTAEQVIEELEEMMQDSPDTEAEHHPSQSDHSMLSLDVQHSSSSSSYEERLGALSVAELNRRLEETEAAIRRLSEELVHHLALRDELDFEKEVKNGFISALIDVQNRQKEHRELLRKKKKIKGAAGSGQGRAEKTHGSYLTTVIPYEKKGHPPSMEDLQILTRILQAMRDDSDKVPGLLTDYILKVLCPT